MLPHLVLWDNTEARRIRFQQWQEDQNLPSNRVWVCDMELRHTVAQATAGTYFLLAHLGNYTMVQIAVDELAVVQRHSDPNVDWHVILYSGGFNKPPVRTAAGTRALLTLDERELEIDGLSPDWYFVPRAVSADLPTELNLLAALQAYQNQQTPEAFYQHLPGHSAAPAYYFRLAHRAMMAKDGTDSSLAEALHIFTKHVAPADPASPPVSPAERLAQLPVGQPDTAHHLQARHDWLQQIRHDYAIF